MAAVLDGAGRRLGPQDLGPAYRDAFPERRLIVVSNREPYEHYIDETTGDIEVRRPAGGLISAIDPLMQAVGGVWVAWGSGDADAQVVDDRQRIGVPPEQPSYTLRRLWLDEQDINHYYFGYSNQFLWPLCHLRPTLTRIRSRYWQRYESVNRRFAEAALEEAGDAAAIWFQDYHLALAPAFVRERAPSLPLAHFWHIPWPSIEIFRIASDAAHLLRGLLANDLLGFHLPLFCDNFLRCAESLAGAQVDWDRRAAILDGHTCFVRALPISTDVAWFQDAAMTAGADTKVERIRQRYAPPGGQLGLGVDRVDYSKGLEEKLAALDQLWRHHEEFRETFTYVQIAVPSRTGIDTYDWLNERIERLAWSINDRHGTGEWRPIHLIKESVPAERLALFYRAADVCVVGSLQDGMNLVAKEFAASQDVNRPGVLVLSKFAGAAEELVGSVEVNPFDTEDFANSLRTALLLSQDERRERIIQLKDSMRTIYDWMRETFVVWGEVARGGVAPLSDADRWSRTR